MQYLWNDGQLLSQVMESYVGDINTIKQDPSSSNFKIMK